MKNKSIFSQIMLLVIISLVCIIVTIGIALLCGSLKTDLINFENLNFSNMFPVLIAGIFISCVIVGIGVLFIARTIFLKFKNYSNETNKKEEN